MVVLGVVVTVGIASGGMKGITFVQAFQYWLKLTALAIPAIFLVMFLHHPPINSIGRRGPADVPPEHDGRVPRCRDSSSPGASA